MKAKMRAGGPFDPLRVDEVVALENVAMEHNGSALVRRLWLTAIGLLTELRNERAKRRELERLISAISDRVDAASVQILMNRNHDLYGTSDFVPEEGNR